MKDYEEMNYNELAIAVKELQAEHKAAKDIATAIYQKLEVLTTKIIPDKLAEDGFRSVNLADGGRIQLSSQAYCSTREGMKPALFAWLQEHDFPELITEVVNASTLKAFIKEQTELGNDVPPDEIVNYQPYSKASVVGVKL
jgi:hypothetical protein